MPSNKVPPSSPRWLSARRWLLLGAALALTCLALFLLRRRSPPVPVQVTAPSVARTPRSTRRVEAAATEAARLRPRIAGSVRDAEGKPVVGAQVCAWAPPRDGVVTKQAAPRCANVDGAGAYTLADLMPVTPLTISAFAPRFAPVGYRGPDGLREIRLGDGEQRRGVDLVLARAGVPLRGSVNDLTGGAVPGAFVASEDGPDRAVGTSDAKGEFTLWVEPGRVRVEATASGYAPGRAVGSAPDHFFKINLVPGATLVGRTVITGSGEPVAGVFVQGIQMEGGWQRASTRTDEEGRFRIEGLPPGRYRVEATAEGRQGYSPSSTTLAMGDTSPEVRVELDPAYVVRGRVVDKATGEPCKDGQVTLHDPKQSEYAQASIGPDGWARMASVFPGTYSVQVHCRDHVPRDDYPKITVAGQDAPPLTWEVDKGALVRVEVVDAQRRPVMKADVMASGTGPGMPSAYAPRADADGTFVLAGLKAGEYNVSVRTPEGSEGRELLTTSLDREQRIKIELPAVGVLEGVVEDTAHRPAANVQVVASGPRHAYATTLDDGTFSLTGLPSGEYEVRVRGAGVRSGGQQDEPVTKVTLAASDRAKVKLTVEARSGVIEGRVVDGAGAPVTDAFVDFVLGGEAAAVPRYEWGRTPVLTDNAGHFTLEGLADGEYGIRAYRKGGAESYADHVKVGTRGLVIKLDAGASIAGTLMSRGAPVERFHVTVRKAQTGFYRTESFFHAGGQFEIRDLPAGTYEVRAETPLGRATTEIQIADGERKTGVALALELHDAPDDR